jgi:5-methyltetrahydrofolate--homocysteine methyltransferase
MGKTKITLLDGAVGTSLWAKTGDRGPVWRYNIENPEIVKELATQFYNVGAKIILTNTFGANRDAVARTEYSVEEIVSSGVKIIKNVLRGKDALTALAIGPLSQMLEPFGDLSEADCKAIYEQQIGAGMQEKPDIIYLMTFMDIEMMRIATEVAKQYQVPVFCSMTFGDFSRTMMGNSVEDIISVLQPMNIDAVGMNCSLGPDKALPIIKEFREKTSMPILFKPNAGKPIINSNGEEEKPYTADIFAKDVAMAFPYADFVGGCCGCDPDYLAAVKKELDAYQKA